MAVDMAGTVDLLQEAIEEEPFVEDLIYDDDEPDEDLLAAATERGAYSTAADERENRSDDSSADKPKKQRDPISWIASMEGKDANGRGGSSEKESEKPALHLKLGAEKDSRRGGGQVPRSDAEPGAGAGTSKRQVLDSGRTNGAVKTDRLASDRSGKELADKDRKSDRAGRGRHPDADERYGYVREVRPPLRERQQTRVAVPAANHARSKSPRPSRLRATRSRSPDRGRQPTATTSPVIELRLLEKFLAQEGIPLQRWEAFRLSYSSAEKPFRRKTGWDQPPPGREADRTLEGARGSDRDRKASPISPRPAGALPKEHLSPSSPKEAAKVERKEADAKGRSDHERKRLRDLPSSQADQQGAKKPRSAEPPSKAKPAQEPLKNGESRIAKDPDPSKRDKSAMEKSARETREDRKPDARAASSSKPAVTSSPTSKDKAGGPSPKDKDSTLKRSEAKDKQPSTVPSKDPSEKGKKGGEELSKQPEKEEARPDARGRDREKERADTSKAARKDKEKERADDLEKSKTKDKLAATGSDRLSGSKSSRKEDPGRPVEAEKKVRKSLFDVPPPVQALPLPPHPATVAAASVGHLPPPPKVDSSNVPRTSHWEQLPAQLPPPPNPPRGADRGGGAQRLPSKVGHVGVIPPVMKVSSRGNSPNLSRRPSRDGRDAKVTVAFGDRDGRKSGAASPPVSMDVPEFWYIDPQGNAMGPHSLVQLRTWLKNLKNRPTYEKEYEEFRHALVWRGRKEDRAKGVALVEMLARYE